MSGDNVVRFPFRPDAFARLLLADDAPMDPDGLLVGSFPQVEPDSPLPVGDNAPGAGPFTDEQGRPIEDDLFERNSFTFRVSREDAIMFGLVEPTPEERARMAADTARWRAESAANRAKPGPALTLESLLHHFDLSAAYAAHLLHPECSCDPFDRDGGYVCPWATELGFDTEEARRARS